MTRIPVPLVPRWLRWLGVVGVAAFVFVFSVLAAPPEQAVVPEFSLVPLDKWRHFLAYGAVAGALGYATVDRDVPTRRLVALVVIVPVVYGFGIELVQATQPDRFFGFGDAYANAIGALLVAPLVALREHYDLIRVP